MVIVLSGHGELHNIQRAYDEFRAHSFLISPCWFQMFETWPKCIIGFWGNVAEFRSTRRNATG